MARFALLNVVISLAGLVSSQSLYIYNNCGDKVHAHQTFGSTSNVYAIPSHTGTFAAIPPNNVGTAVNFYTGCTDAAATSCTTGGVWTAGGQTPFTRGEVTWRDGTAWYNISPLYGYNRGLKINTDDGGCPNFQCTINSGCPVPGPDGSCYAPCCSSAEGCLGTENCPYDPIYGWDHAGKGVHSDFYHTACPNAYSFPDDDCGHYGSSVVASCSNQRVTMTLCPTGSSSNVKLC